jgi:hypothetical protein
MQEGLEMHRWMAAATSALLFLGLASATPAAATPSTSGTDQSDDRMEAALSLSNNLFAGSFTVARNLLPWVVPVVALLSVSPPNDVESSEIRFPPQADEFENGLGNDWQP